MNDIHNPRVVVAGHICLDIIPAFKTGSAPSMAELFVPGRLINMGRVTVSTGGPVSNTGIALTIMGIDTQLMGKIGADFFGDGILSQLKQRQIDSGMRIADGEDTSYTVTIVPPGFDRIFLHNPGANNSFRANDVDYEAVGRADLFHFGYPPLMRGMFENGGLELMTMFRNVKESGVTTALDMSLPDADSESGQLDWESLLTSVLPFVDIYLPSIEETLFMLDRCAYKDLRDQAVGGDPLEHLDVDILPALGDKLLALGAKIAVIKCGVKGYYIRTSDINSLRNMGKVTPPESWASRELYEQSFHVPDIASATGSGDSSIAGFLASLLRGKSIEESIRVACAVGGCNLTAYDALSGIKPWEETLALIPGWEKNRFPVSGRYWRHDERKDVWIGKKDYQYGV